MKKQLSMLAILVGASLNAQAAQSSFFTIVDDEVKGYASGISGDANGLIGLNTKNNMAEYFSTCETYSGERYENVAFRVTMRGELQTEIPVPDYIKMQILDAYKLYEEQNADYPAVDELVSDEDEIARITKNLKK